MTGTGGAEDRQRRCDAMKHAPDVDVDHAIPFVDLQFIQQRKRHQTRVADENIEAAEPILCPLDKSSNIRALSHVKLQRLGLSTRARDFGGEHLQPVVASRAQHHPGAPLGKMARNRLADSTACSGDGDHFTSNFGHHFAPLLTVHSA